MPLVTLDRVSIAFGHLPLLDQVALQIEPNYADALNNLGLTLNEMGRREEALACYRKLGFEFIAPYEEYMLDAK